MELFGWEDHIDPTTVRAQTLVVTVEPFIDAGNTTALLNQHLCNTLDSHRLGGFDADTLIDYRDRRPMIVFDRDHFESYEPPVLELHLMRDRSGEHFLVLSGAEPTLRWEHVAREVASVARSADVGRVILAHGIPMGVPHTRPLLLTRHASDPDLIAGNVSVFHNVQMPASFPSMLELRLGEQGFEVIGLSVHVPQYLTNFEYPDAALALVDHIGRHTRLDLPQGELPQAAANTRQMIDAQIAQSSELMEMVTTLEHHYDSAQRALTAMPERIPDADAIGAEAEEFLRSINDAGENST